MVDAHTHVVPARLPADAARDRRWPSVELSGDKAAVVIGGKVFRKIDSRSWDVGRRLADMEEDGTTMQVLSPMPELLSHWLPAHDAEHLADTINEHIAVMVSEAPRRFAGIGMACVQDVPRALAQLERIKALGLSGIEIGSHVDGVALGSEVLHPLYEAAEALDLCIFVHPLHPAGLERIGAGPEFAATAAFPLETALAAVSLLAAGVLEKFPKLRILLSHGGGALPWILPRLDYGWSLGGEMQKRMTRSPREIARGFFYDSILYDAPALQFMSSVVGSDRIVVGSDYPFTIRQKHPGAFARAALPDCPGVLADNAFAFLGRAFDLEMLHAAASDCHSVASQQA
ncbi:amidohydrolase family protein [Bradyrhizobium sp. Arg237L]|uniref:amidohydrolase family protein n=1 Tax=Bradyrhizobium sp. Arg237L TaxID=3003352 RepID=UPI00249D8CEC|nr:amidohydrolase family protein [Bradyrhizobium sp. Arg237L]MDI4233705.1 amidohydrolase family protein [Bradyrhizobium sp. Arg237L]